MLPCAESKLTPTFVTTLANLLESLYSHRVCVYNLCHNLTLYTFLYRKVTNYFRDAWR